MIIEKRLFQLKQPNFPEEKSTDEYYYLLANRLADTALKERTAEDFDDSLVARAAICVIGYYQDIISDGGVWRGFINEMRRLYARTVPFFDTDPETYIDYELNSADVRFLVWYSIAMQDDSRRDMSPLDRRIKSLSDLWCEILEEEYDEAPEPEDYRMTHEM